MIAPGPWGWLYVSSVGQEILFKDLAWEGGLSLLILLLLSCIFLWKKGGDSDGKV